MRVELQRREPLRHELEVDLACEDPGVIARRPQRVYVGQQLLCSRDRDLGIHKTVRDGLERPDDLTELLAVLRVFERELVGPGDSSRRTRRESQPTDAQQMRMIAERGGPLGSAGRPDLRPGRHCQAGEGAYLRVREVEPSDRSGLGIHYEQVGSDRPGLDVPCDHGAAEGHLRDHGSHIARSDSGEKCVFTARLEHERCQEGIDHRERSTDPPELLLDEDRGRKQFGRAQLGPALLCGRPPQGGNVAGLG